MIGLQVKINSVTSQVPFGRKNKACTFSLSFRFMLGFCPFCLYSSTSLPFPLNPTLFCSIHRHEVACGMCPLQHVCLLFPPILGFKVVTFPASAVGRGCFATCWQMCSQISLYITIITQFKLLLIKDEFNYQFDQVLNIRLFWVKYSTIRLSSTELNY